MSKTVVPEAVCGTSGTGCPSASDTLTSATLAAGQGADARLERLKIMARSWDALCDAGRFPLSWSEVSARTRIGELHSPEKELVS